MFRRRFGFERVVVVDAQILKAFGRQDALIAIHSTGKIARRRRADQARVRLGLIFERVQLILHRRHLRGNDRGRALVGASAQNKSLELRRKICDGVHVAAADVLGERRQVAHDLGVERSLICEARRGAVSVSKLVELTAQLRDPPLAFLRVVRQVAGRDRLALLCRDHGDAVLRLDHRFTAHNVARGIIARACRVLHDGHGRQRLMDRGRDVVAEVGRDRREQDPKDDGRIMLALFHNGSFACAQGAARLIPASEEAATTG